MRIKLTTNAEEALQAIMTEVLLINAFIERDNRMWIDAIISTFKQNFTHRMRDDLVQALSTPESMRQALLSQIEQASLGMDAQAIRALEAGIHKLKKKEGTASRKQAM